MPKLYIAARQLDWVDPRTNRVIRRMSEEMVQRIQPPDIAFLIEPVAGATPEAVPLWLANQLTARGVGPGTLTHLYISSHGRSGRVNLGREPGFTSADVWRWYPLRAFFSRAYTFLPRIILSGCNVGSATATRETMFGADGDHPTGHTIGDPCAWGGVQGGPGYALLHNFARLFNLTAIGGLNDQNNYGNWEVASPYLMVDPWGQHRLDGFDENLCINPPYPSSP